MKKCIIIICVIIVVLIVAFVLYKNFNEDTSNELENDNYVNNSGQNEENDNEITIENDVENVSINNEEDLEEEESEEMNQEEIKVNLIVNNKSFSATLINNDTVNELIQNFPLTLNMSDLNSNEKYNYLDFILTTNSSRPNRINAGDIKLYGNDCLVIFYESFSTPYSYTDLGTVDDVDGFLSELGSGNVTITFEVAN